MIYKLHVYMVECDGCRVSVRQEAPSEGAAVPKGWERGNYYCGDSYCSGHATLNCPGCQKKQREDINGIK